MIKRYNNISLLIGAPAIAIQIGGVLMRSTANPGSPEDLMGAILMVGGGILLIIGLAFFAKSRGHSAWFGLVGLLSFPGMIILHFLEDRSCDIESGPSGWPAGATGDAYRQLVNQGFDFDALHMIDFRIDLDTWPPPGGMMNTVKTIYPQCTIVPLGEDCRYVQFQLHGRVSHQFVTNVQRLIAKKLKPYGGRCEAWGVNGQILDPLHPAQTPPMAPPQTSSL